MSISSPKGKLVIQTLAMPADTNANGDIFGGWVLAQMDLGAGILGKHFSQSKTATVAIDSMCFEAPIFVGDIVTCYADMLSVGRSSMKILIQTWVTRSTGLCVKVTEGTFTMVAVTSDGKAQPANPVDR